MNALYVTVCIPFLLVLAGFNHAHGFTTFGKTPTNPQTQPPPPHVPAKPCGNHTECYSIPQTSCVSEIRTPTRKSCLCGDYKPPANGVCHAQHKGPNHICASDDECVDGADCQPIGVAGALGTQEVKICKCVEGYTQYESECNGVGYAVVNLATILMQLALLNAIF